MFDFEFGLDWGVGKETGSAKSMRVLECTECTRPASVTRRVRVGAPEGRISPTRLSTVREAAGLDNRRDRGPFGDCSCRAIPYGGRAGMIVKRSCAPAPVATSKSPSWLNAIPALVAMSSPTAKPLCHPERSRCTDSKRASQGSHAGLGSRPPGSGPFHPHPPAEFAAIIERSARAARRPGER